MNTQNSVRANNYSPILPCAAPPISPIGLIRPIRHKAASLHTGSIHCASPSADRRSARAAAPLRSSGITQCAALSALRSSGTHQRHHAVCRPICRLGISGTTQCAALSADRRSGFTLVELLVAAAISMVLVTLLLTTVQSIASNYLRTQASVTQAGDASVVLDQLVQDLEGLVIPNSPGAEALLLTPEPISGEMLTGRNTQNSSPAWLVFLSTVTDDDTSTNRKENGKNTIFTGGTRAVSYRIGCTNIFAGGDKSYALFRSIAPADDTFDNALGTPNQTRTNALSQFWSARKADTLSAESFSSENIVGFYVSFAYTNGRVTNWTKPQDTVRIGRNGASVNGSPIIGGFLGAKVGVSVLSSEGVKRLQSGAITDMSELMRRYGRISVRETARF